MEYWERSIPWTFSEEQLSYEEKRNLRYSLHNYMLKTIPFNSYESKLVLEVGSGSGIDSAEFAKHGAEVMSLDFTENGTRSTRDLFREIKLTPRVVRATAQSLPFPDATFDLVYSFGVLHHIPDIQVAVKEIARVLRPKGELICMLYNRESILYAYSILFLHRNEGLSEEEMVRTYSERILGCPYTEAYTKAESSALLASFFEQIDAKVFYNVVDLPGKRKFKLNIPDDYELGWHIILKASRKEKIPI